VKVAAALCLLLALGDACAAGTESPPGDWYGSWRITRGVGAPWTPGAPQRAEIELVGSTLEFAPGRVDGPGVLGCTDAHYTPTRVPAQGLFQGGLPEPAELAAEALGIPALPATGFSLACSSGVFEFHAAGDALLFALDNVIWTLSRSAGALASSDSPEGFVQRFLESHFAGPMGFDPESAALKRARLSRALGLRIDAYFARPRPTDEVPPVDGDPFTDSQEYPTRFAVRAGKSLGGAYEVPVDFADAHRTTRVAYLLVQEGGAWRVDELSTAHGTLGELLAE
jgi:hypothetical protein